MVGCVAQLVEQLTLNQRVRGSSPRSPTNIFNGLAALFLLGNRFAVCVTNPFSPKLVACVFRETSHPALKSDGSGGWNFAMLPAVRTPDKTDPCSPADISFGAVGLKSRAPILPASGNHACCAREFKAFATPDAETVHRNP